MIYSINALVVLDDQYPSTPKSLPPYKSPSLPLAIFNIRNLTHNKKLCMYSGYFLTVDGCHLNMGLAHIFIELEKLVECSHPNPHCTLSSIHSQQGHHHCSKNHKTISDGQTPFKTWSFDWWIRSCLSCSNNKPILSAFDISCSYINTPFFGPQQVVLVTFKLKVSHCSILHPFFSFL